MGQYYYPTLIDGNRLEVFYSHDYENGLKLMEHSYIGNYFVNAVVSQIAGNPMKVAWIGDYSDEEYGDPYEKKRSNKQFMSIFKRVMARKKYEKPEPIKQSVDSISGYLVNHTQKIVIDLKKYVAANKWHDTWFNKRVGRTEECDMCIHPLPLLTACGNGRGHGDYCVEYPDYDKVGTWAFDVIEYTHKKPEGYSEVMYRFIEKEETK